MTSQTATASGGATGGLMNLSYGYQASAGQSGAGTTVGNSGQLMSVSGTIGGLTESASYSYDLQGRLTTSSQTTNGASAQRRFAYDRFGNRTGVWDAVSGGTQIQAVTLHQSGGAATNRLTSVTDSGVTKNYTYDAAGNLINDGVHSYEYDAENRLKAVDWGSANGVAYAYDYANRRIKKLAAGVSTNYVWEGSQVIAEHDGTSGAVIFNYVYASGKLIARMGSGIIKWYVSDRLSSRLVLDDAGAIVGRQGHLPYGEEIGGSGEQEKHKFTTYERDGESGTDYAVNRQYAQGVGRFMRVDPVEGTIANPQSLNRYAYVQNEPVNRVDPLGLFFRGDMPFECILYPILCEPWWIPEYDTRPRGLQRDPSRTQCKIKVLPTGPRKGNYPAKEYRRHGITPNQQHGEHINNESKKWGFFFEVQVSFYGGPLNKGEWVYRQVAFSYGTLYGYFRDGRKIPRDGYGTSGSDEDKVSKTWNGNLYYVMDSPGPYFHQKFVDPDDPGYIEVRPIAEGQLTFRLLFSMTNTRTGEMCSSNLTLTIRISGGGFNVPGNAEWDWEAPFP